LIGANANEREALHDILTATTGLAKPIATHRLTVIADKGYYGHDFEAELTGAGINLLRPAGKGEPAPGQRFLKPLRQIIESTFKGQLDLEQHRGRTRAGVSARVAQRVLRLTTAI
jgi:hypothetical protein